MGENHPRNLKLVKTAKKLRRQLTDTERKFWHLLRDRRFENIKFRRQYPIGRYIADFICVEKRLIVEFDGGQHAESMRDQRRDEWLKTQGYTVLRFWNNEALKNPDGVADTILQALATLSINPHFWRKGNPHPNLLPEREKEQENPHPGPLPEREREKCL